MLTRSAKTARSHRGAVAVLTALTLALILGIAALAIDMSWLVSARDQLQAGVDNTAISSAYYIANYQPYPNTSPERIALSGMTTTYGVNFMHTNPVENQALFGSSVQTGRATRDANGRVIGFTYNPSNFNAVRVITNMSGNNPELPSFFGQIFGKESYTPSATAISLLRPNPGALIPFTVHRTIWDAYLTNPQAQSSFQGNPIIDQDNWIWDEELSMGVYSPGAGDGIPEIKIFPHQAGGCGGNFGTLNINIGNEGSLIEEQIENGVTSGEVDDELTDDGWGGPFIPVTSTYPYPYPGFGTPTHWFGRATTSPMGITGNPGISSGMEPSVETRINTLVGIFVHTSCSGGGANATYTIGEIRFAWLLAVDLSAGSNDLKYIWVQPSSVVPTSSQLAGNGFYQVIGLGK